MYHQRFTGSHYEIGYRWGSLLAKHGKYILDQIPFYITKDRIDYAEASIPVYQDYFPEILEEIQGIADGQRSKNKLFRAVLIRRTLLLFCSIKRESYYIRKKQRFSDRT